MARPPDPSSVLYSVSKRRGSRARASTVPGERLERGIVRLLSRQEVPQGAYDLISGLREVGITAPQMSVYRALNRLMQRGAIERVETLSAFRVRDKDDAVLLICIACGRTMSLDAHAQHQALRSNISSGGFTLIATAIEAKGRCAECIRKEEETHPSS